MLVNFSYSMGKKWYTAFCYRGLESLLSTLKDEMCSLYLWFVFSLTIFVFVCLLFRDYTNPYLPVAPSAIDGSGQVKININFLLDFLSSFWLKSSVYSCVQFGIGIDGKKEPESNVLLASIENMQYDVTIDVLHTVCYQHLFIVSSDTLASMWC